MIITGAGLTGQTDSNHIRLSLAYPVYSQYLQNGLIINPAYAGSREALSFFASYRQQWIGVEGAPTFESFSIHSMLKNDHVGLGLTFQTLQYGVTRGTSLYADYAYHINLGKSRLSLGLKAGFDMSNDDYSGIITIDPNDPAFASNAKYFMPNVGAGAYFYNKKFFIGASIPSFLSYEKSSNGKISFDTFQKFDIQATAGALIKIAEGFKFKPSVFVDYWLDNSKQTRLDINGNFIIHDFVWIGGSWRTNEKAVVGIVQVQLNAQMMIGFSYDYPLGSMSQPYSSGSPEIVVRYEFGYKVTAANPRYF
ncbi:MAG: type IX secretion system membrane protein PorP/SprF [Bacteroidales bacterium]